MSSTYERLSAILMRDYAVPAERLMPETPLSSLGIDSLGTVELLWTIEEAFHIKLPAEPVDLPTLADVVQFVDGLMASQGVGALHPA
jgi:acyl carrier protein